MSCSDIIALGVPTVWSQCSRCEGTCRQTQHCCIEAGNIWDTSKMSLADMERIPMKYLCALTRAGAQIDRDGKFDCRAVADGG